METITFKHSGNCGDIIYSLPNIKAYCDKHNTKATFYIKLDTPAQIPIPGHPLGNVMMNQAMFDMLKPLLEAQYYINNAIAYRHESIPPINFDLDLFRQDNKNLGAGNIAQWIGNSYPELRPNLMRESLENLFIQWVPSGRIIVNRSSRYHNLFFDYSILKDYDNIYFVGVESEFRALYIHNPNIQYLKVNNFLEMAREIQCCKLFIGNQSMAFAIAEQLKVKRILEQYAAAPNVIPQGGEYWVCHTSEQFKKAVYSALNGKNTDNNTTKTGQAEAHIGQ